MMDPRRLSTSEILRSGILYRTPPESLVPDGVTLHGIGYDDEVTTQYLSDLLEKGGIASAQDYGCWEIWKTGDGYDGQLMQYCRRTAEFQGYSLDDAARQAYEWYRRMDGYDEWD